MSQPGATSVGGHQYEQIRVEGESKVQMGNIHNHNYSDHRVTILVVSNEIIDSCKRLTAQPLSPLPLEHDVAKLGENVAKLATTSANANEVDITKILAAFQKSKGTLENIEERLASPSICAKEQKQKSPEMSAQEMVGISARLRQNSQMLEKYSLELQKPLEGKKALFNGLGSGPSILDATKGKGTAKRTRQSRFAFFPDEATGIKSSAPIPKINATNPSPSGNGEELPKVAASSLLLPRIPRTIPVSNFGALAASNATKEHPTEKQAKSSSAEAKDDTAVDYFSLVPPKSRLTNAVIDKPMSRLSAPQQKHARNRSVGAKPLSTELKNTTSAVLTVPQVGPSVKVSPKASSIRLKAKPSSDITFTPSPDYPSAWAQQSLSKLESNHTRLFPTNLQPLTVRPLRADDPGILGWKKSARSVMYGREGLLLHYTKRGMLGELGELLRNKPMNVNGYPGSYGNALHSAVAYGQRNAIPLLLHHGADINFQLRPTSQYIGASLPEYCRNAVMIAIARQDNEMLKFLILNGANVNIKVPKVDSALKLAILMGNLEITQTLIGHGAVIHDDAKELGDALQAAAFCGQCAIIKYLCDNGANVNARSGVLGSALQAASCMHHLAAVCLLIQRGAKFDFPCGTIFGSALHAAAFAGSVAIVKILLEQGQADVHAYGGIYGSALHAAARQGHVQVVKTLVDAGANVNHDIRLEASMFGTPLQAAALCGADDVVKELLARGADPDGVGYYATKTPLVHAIEQNHPRVVFSLVNGGTVLEPKEKKPRPLLAACESGRPQISSFLISKGAKASREDIVAATKAGHVAVAGVLLDSNPLLTKDSYFLHTAIHMEREDMAKLFIKHGADTNLVNRDLTPLQRAVRHKHVGIVQLLLGHGADPNGPDDSSTPPLVLAVERLDTNIVQILLNAGADPNKREIKYTKATHEDMFRKWSLNLAKPNAFAPNLDTKTLLHDAKQRIEKRKAMKSPMRVAVEKGAPEILDILLKHSGNANESGSYIGARSLLSLAIDKEDAVMVDRLLKAGADVQADTLSLAIAKGQMDVVRCILCAGALLKHDEDFLLPAIEAQNRALVEMLLEHGAKVEPKHQLAAGTNNMWSVVNGQGI